VSAGACAHALLTARVSGGGGGGGAVGEATFDPTIPPEKQKVTYQAKDGSIKTVTKAELQEQMETSEKLMESLTQTFEDKMKTTQAVHVERERALEELGITVEKNNVGVHTPKRTPHLVNLNEDPLMSECLIYQLKDGLSTVGRMDSDKPAAIRLSGESILDEHCYFEHKDGKVTLHTLPNAVTVSRPLAPMVALADVRLLQFLNGKQIEPGQTYRLRSGFRIILGEHHVFRFNNPEEVRKRRDRATAKSSLHISVSAADLEAAASTGSAGQNGGGDPART
jgi:kinesin family protein 1